MSIPIFVIGRLREGMWSADDVSGVACGLNCYDLGPLFCILQTHSLCRKLRRQSISPFIMYVITSKVRRLLRSVVSGPSQVFRQFLFLCVFSLQQMNKRFESKPAMSIAGCGNFADDHLAVSPRVSALHLPWYDASTMFQRSASKQCCDLPANVCYLHTLMHIVAVIVMIMWALMKCSYLPVLCWASLTRQHCRDAQRLQH